MDTPSPFERLAMYPRDLGECEVGRAVAISDDEYVLFPIDPNEMVCKYSIITNTWTTLMKLDAIDGSLVFAADYNSETGLLYISSTESIWALDLEANTIDHVMDIDDKRLQYHGAIMARGSELHLIERAYKSKTLLHFKMNMDSDEGINSISLSVGGMI